jgi:hypothetical protein
MGVTCPLKAVISEPPVLRMRPSSLKPSTESKNRLPVFCVPCHRRRTSILIYRWNITLLSKQRAATTCRTEQRKWGEFEYDVDLNADLKGVQEFNGLLLKTVGGSVTYLLDV